MIASPTFITDENGQAYQFMLYLPYNASMFELKLYNYSTKYRFNGKVLDAEKGLYYYVNELCKANICFTAKCNRLTSPQHSEDCIIGYYDPRISLWYGVYPMTEKYPDYSAYTYTNNNPIRFIDLDGEDWVEEDHSTWDKIRQFFGVDAGEKKINWHENINSQADLGKNSGSKWLGKNVIVATHNRDKEFKEPINTAKFDIYLESCTEGPSSTFYGNTVPADNCKSGVLSPGIYSATSGHRSKAKYENETAILLNNGGLLPSELPNPNHEYRFEMDGIFIHSGNPNQESLFDSRGNPYSTGCQTTGSGPIASVNGGAKVNHDKFKAGVGKSFSGFYYLRGR